MYTILLLRLNWSFGGIEDGCFREQRNRLLPFPEYQIHNFVAFEIDSSRSIPGKMTLELDILPDDAIYNSHSRCSIIVRFNITHIPWETKHEVRGLCRISRPLGNFLNCDVSAHILQLLRPQIINRTSMPVRV